VAQFLPVEPAACQQHQAEHLGDNHDAEQGGQSRIHPRQSHLDQQGRHGC
jgi:hypothetical protein